MLQGVLLSTVEENFPLGGPMLSSLALFALADQIYRLSFVTHQNPGIRVSISR